MSERGRHLLLAGALAAWLASPCAAAVVCVNPQGRAGCRTTIQAGVDRARAGEVVRVGAGVYFENVVVPAGKDRLQIVGAGPRATSLDADAPNAGSALVIQSPLVRCGV